MSSWPPASKYGPTIASSIVVLLPMRYVAYASLIGAKRVDGVGMLENV